MLNIGDLTKVASLYVVLLAFTAATILAIVYLIHGDTLPTPISYIIGAGLGFALNTLGIHVGIQSQTGGLNGSNVPPTPPVMPKV